LQLLGELLTEHGARVELASSADEALSKLTSHAPDVLISDIGMPQMDGYALVAKIRSLPAERGGKTPAIALTAYARGEDAQRARLAGFQRHLSKPVEPSKLVTLIAKLGGRAQNSELD
jgi:CheY-like chemotaxis protein